MKLISPLTFFNSVKTNIHFNKTYGFRYVFPIKSGQIITKDYFDNIFEFSEDFFRLEFVNHPLIYSITKHEIINNEDGHLGVIRLYKNPDELNITSHEVGQFATSFNLFNFGEENTLTCNFLSEIKVNYRDLNLLKESEFFIGFFANNIEPIKDSSLVAVKSFGIYKAVGNDYFNVIYGNEDGSIDYLSPVNIPIQSSFTKGLFHIDKNPNNRYIEIEGIKFDLSGKDLNSNYGVYMGYYHPKEFTEEEEKDLFLSVDYINIYMDYNGCKPYDTD